MIFYICSNISIANFTIINYIKGLLKHSLNMFISFIFMEVGVSCFNLKYFYTMLSDTNDLLEIMPPYFSKILISSYGSTEYPLENSKFSASDIESECSPAFPVVMILYSYPVIWESSHLGICYCVQIFFPI